MLYPFRLQVNFRKTFTFCYCSTLKRLSILLLTEQTNTYGVTMFCNFWFILCFLCMYCFLNTCLLWSLYLSHASPFHWSCFHPCLCEKPSRVLLLHLIFFSCWLHCFRKKINIHVRQICLNSKTPFTIQATSMESTPFPFRRPTHLTPLMLDVKHWLLASRNKTLTSLCTWIMKWCKLAGWLCEPLSQYIFTCNYENLRWKLTAHGRVWNAFVFKSGFIDGQSQAGINFKISSTPVVLEWCPQYLYSPFSLILFHFYFTTI